MKTLVILGAGIAALPIIRQLMRDVVLKSDEYRMVVIAPNTHMLFPIPLPRVVVPGQIGEDEVLIPLKPHFEQYPSEKFDFILGKAQTLLPTTKTIEVTQSAGETRRINYDELIIATGASVKDDMPWLNMESTEQTRAKIQDLQEGVALANTIVVAGGGPTGVEIAGELGFEYSKTRAKRVYLVYNDNLPLGPYVTDKVRSQAKVELERLNVDLISGAKITEVSRKDGSAKVVVTATGKDGTARAIEADLYLPALGMVPNTQFAPSAMLDQQGFIKQNSRLQADGYANIFVVGDAGSLEISTARVADRQSVHLIRHLPSYLLRGDPLPEYTRESTGAFAVTIGRSKATGSASGWRLPSFLIWWLKGRTMLVEQARSIAMGRRTSSTIFEKGS